MIDQDRCHTITCLVARQHQVTPLWILDRGREYDRVAIRRQAMRRMHKAGLTVSAIARYFAMDRKTVRHHCKLVTT